MKRREFLEVTGAGMAGLWIPGPLRALARPGFVGSEQGQKQRPVLVVIYLRGGIDPLNTIVPYADRRYYEIRPTIAIPAEDSNEAKGVIPLDDRFGLHPALADLKPLYDAKLMAPILNVGSPHPTRSHFDAQDFMEYAAPGLRNVQDGWLNRYLGATRARKQEDEPSLRGVAVQGLLPRSLRGSYPVLAAPVRHDPGTDEILEFYDDLYVDADKKTEDAEIDMAGRRDPEDDDPVLSSGETTITAMRRYLAILDRGARGSADSTYPEGRLGPGLRAISAVIRSHPDLEVACVDWNGWDHHAGQGGLEGKQATMLRHLGQSLAAFMDDLGSHRERTLVLTMSEFGRTCRENGNAGTDHGHGGLMLALGGPVRGGRILGKWRGLDDGDLYEGRDLPVTVDFRDVQNEILTQHLGFKPSRSFFPDYRPSRGVGLLG